MKSKLHNFPPIYVISLEPSVKRRESIKEQFNLFGVTNINYIISKREENNLNVIFVGKNADQCYMDHGTPITISHLKAIKEWYYNSTTEYAFFCEDDLSLESVQYWNFNWEDFVKRLPENWGCVQLSLIRQYFFAYGDKFKRRVLDDWSAAAYLMNRDHAKDLINQYCLEDNCYNLNIKTNWMEYIIANKYYWALQPGVEHVIFSEPTPRLVYSFQLFLEEIKFHSVNNERFGIRIGEWHKESHELVVDWWKNIGQYRTLDEIF